MAERDSIPGSTVESTDVKETAKCERRWGELFADDGVAVSCSRPFSSFPVCLLSFLGPSLVSNHHLPSSSSSSLGYIARSLTPAFFALHNVGSLTPTLRTDPGPRVIIHTPSLLLQPAVDKSPTCEIT